MKDREFINPFTDFGFKRIFGQEISKEILIDWRAAHRLAELQEPGAATGYQRQTTGRV